MAKKRSISLPCSLEIAFRSAGFRAVCGVDEAGRGPLAGPVVAAAVILRPGGDVSGIRDSKKVAHKKREELYERITESALAYCVASVDAPKIDRINILQASLLAMRLAVEGLGVKADALLVDGNFTVPGFADSQLAQKAVVGGDSQCASIAAASILAKVSRDRRMVEYDEVYPGYAFGRHKGYGTAEHMGFLRELGPSPIHRRSFEPVRVALLQQRKREGEGIRR